MTMTAIRFSLCWCVLFALLSGSASVSATDTRPARVHVISNDFVSTGKFIDLQVLALDAGIELTAFQIEQAPADAAAWFDADLVILDTPRGSDRRQVMAFSKPWLGNSVRPWLAVGGGPVKGGQLPERVLHDLAAYYAAGGKDNLTHMMQYLSALHRGESTEQLPPAVPLPTAGYYHPAAKQPFTDLDAYFAWGKDRWQQDAPVLAIAMSSGVLRDQQTAFHDQLVAAIESTGAVPLLFWYGRKQSDALYNMLAPAKPTLLLNTTHMLDGEAMEKAFRALNIPVVMGLSSRQTLAQWRSQVQGMDAGMAAVLMATPERWGMSDPLVLSAMEDGRRVAIPEQVELLIGRFLATARLQREAPESIKLALMFWNSPAGERNLSASHLNVPRSIADITAELASSGYSLLPLDEEGVINKAQSMLSGLYRHDQLDALLAKGQAISFPVSRYRQWLSSLPGKIQHQVLHTWGEPDQHWSIRTLNGESQFVIPAMKLGNFIWMPQPPRADRLGAHVHDSAQPPGHLFQATYLYLREVYGADALIHLGTHGTQEWTPGKDRGLWAYDYPNLAVGNLPVFYPYIQDNIGEALQAKRRGRAIVISHQTPAFGPAGLYAELTHLHELMHTYQMLDSGPVKVKAGEQLLNAAIEQNLHVDMGWDEEGLSSNPPAFAAALHDHLHELAAASTPLGLHTFGTASAPEYRVMTVLQQLGMPYFDALGVEGDELLALESEQLQQQPAYQLLAETLASGKLPEQALPEPLMTLLQQALDNDVHLSMDNEMEALLAGLKGRFVTPGPGGDPVRNPATSSGTNLYAFEPDKIPNKAAYAAAEGMLDQLVERYREEHEGASPRRLAFTLWSSEAIRTQGLIEAQIMHALGVRPIWDEGGRVRKLEIIPQAELKHPRIDVLLQVTSVYRDQFDGLMRQYAEVIELLSERDYPSNPIAVQSRQLADALRQKGLSDEEARQLSRARLFSSPPGSYGSGVTDLAMNSTAWEDDSQLADTFVASQSHVFTTHEWGRPVADLNLLQDQLAQVDAVLMSRSSQVHGLLSTDHPFEYLGGLSAAVRQQRGENPALYVSDYRGNSPRIADAAAFLSAELRTRYQNPQWIKAMKAEGYSGAVQMLKPVNNLFGWQVMDAGMVRADQWQAMHETYVMDRHDLGLNEWFAEQNPDAQSQLIERMVEAVRKGYWQADETTLKQLTKRWQTLQEKGALPGAPKTVDYIQDMALGFGLSAQPSPSSSADSADISMKDDGQPSQQVKGQVLEAQEMNAPKQDDWSFRLALVFMLLLLASGAWRAHREQKNHLNNRDIT